MWFPWPAPYNGPFVFGLIGFDWLVRNFYFRRKLPQVLFLLTI